MTDHAGHYAFPHAGANERRRLELFAERLDPLTVRRIKALDLAPSARCLEVGGGRGSIARWLCEYVGPAGRVTATDLETGFLSELSLPNLDVLRHDVTSDEFPERSFDLVHVRAVLMHLPDRMAVLRRMVSWLAPGGWLLAEDCDFGLSALGDAARRELGSAEQAGEDAGLGEDVQADQDIDGRDDPVSPTDQCAGDAVVGHQPPSSQAPHGHARAKTATVMMAAPPLMVANTGV